MTNSRIQRLDANVVAQEIDILDGHLLGDGSVFKSDKNRIHCIYSHRCKEKEYLLWVANNTSFLLGQNINIVTVFDSRTQKSYTGYHLKSKSNQVFTDARFRWYPNGKKVLATDLLITSRLLLRFYLDDGSYCKGGAYLATNDFCLDDVEKLAEKIAQYCNFKVTVHRTGDKKGEQYKVYIAKRNFQEFLKIIGDCPVDCYLHKWGE